MAAATHNYTWAQGEDLTIEMVYSTGPEGAETPQDLSAYSARMDIVGLDGVRRYTLNSDPITDVDPILVGDQADAVTEIVTLSVDGEIGIEVPRSLTLPGGALYADITANPPLLTFNYDVFLRDASNKQKKILKGTITVEKSYTLWP
jgi:hypothetical protein